MISGSTVLTDEGQENIDRRFDRVSKAPFWQTTRTFANLNQLSVEQAESLAGFLYEVAMFESTPSKHVRTVGQE